MTSKAKGVRFYARQIHVFSLLTLWFFKFYQIMCVRVCVLLMHTRRCIQIKISEFGAIVLIRSSVWMCLCVYD